MAATTASVARIVGLPTSSTARRAIAGNLPGFIFRQVVTGEGTFGNAYFSERLKEMTGVPGQEITSGHGTLLDHVHADDRERLVRTLSSVPADPRPSLIEEPDDFALPEVGRAVAVQLSGGVRLEGELRFVPVVGRGRISDVLNEPTPSFALHVGTRAHHVAKLHVLTIDER